MTVTNVRIRKFKSSDFPAWLPLWDGNNMGQRDQSVTTETWSRLIDPSQPVYGLGAFKDTVLTGLVHYVLHPTTGSIAPVCYMQDVFVNPEHRKQGIARKLVKALAARGKTEKWARLYWLAESDNLAAENLYKNFGRKLDFNLHILPLD